ncbi:MAG: glutamate 5-kinase [Dehalococcoidia bacterium]|nr:glutamate 5-kinase [Dehalococcoidia bacterium]
MTAERISPQRIEYRRIVVKVGSNVLTGGSEALDTPTMAHIAEQIASLESRGAEVIVITSGAIAAGRHRLATHRESHSLPARDIESRQALAAIGQSRLMAFWDELFEQHNLPIAQALLTRRDLADRLGYLNARNTLLNLIGLRVVPIVNENDVVSVEEISDSKIGDNDNLSAQVANLVDADLLLILTDIAGLYTADPSRDPNATLIREVEHIDDSVFASATGAPGARGTGGMTTKVQAARIATAHGAHVVLADGRARDIVLRAVSGEAVGTHFHPAGDRTESRRRYLLSGLQAKGHVVVDAGAARAVLAGGKSLLPAGVVACEGTFSRGDVIRVHSSDGVHLASGMSNYSADEVKRILGLHSDQIEQALGYEYGEEVIHRNNLVLV